MVKIRFLGACQEVGRSGVLIQSEESGDSILCDYGTKTDYTQLFPDHVSGKDLSAIVLSHSHIDHCGGLPLFYISGSVPLYCTELTFKISEILLQDMLKINQNYLPFGKFELLKMKKYINFMLYGQRRKVGKKSYITLYNAGHIPGSAMILVEMDGKKILYTGDINTTKTRLLDPADPKILPEIDCIITEATYGTTDHENRNEIEEQFNKEVNSILNNKGIVLIPAFGVARSQEMLMVLNKDGKPSHRVTLDGMARKIAVMYENYPGMFSDPKLFQKSINNTHFINQRKREQERKKAATSVGVIVAPSGMLKGGTARYYAENIISNENNAIYLVSYQIEDTPGRYLLDHSKYVLDDPEHPIPVNAAIKKYSFSSHSGKSDLIEFLSKIVFKDKKSVFCVHGDSKVLISFTNEIKQLGYSAESPLMGQSYTI